MLQFSILFFGLVATSITSINALPLEARIAQDTPASTKPWEDACEAAGGGEQCNPVAVAAFATLLAAPGPCAQQDAADQMINLANTLGSDPDMIRLTQVWVQQPRNSPDSVSTPYCQQPPQNPELNGLFQCQWVGNNPQTFAGGLTLGDDGTIPFGLSSLDPLGACSAHTDGPIEDGIQLVDLTQDPGVVNAPSDGGDPPSSTGAPTATDAPAATDAPSPTTSLPTDPSSSPFVLQNGLDAQKLNKSFLELTADSSCQDGEDSCVGTSFAQCVAGKFVTIPCGASTQCAALPLVNKPGTSITCTTAEDAAARIAATGATGGITGA